MDQLIRNSLDALRSDKKELQNQAFQHFLAATASPVDWAYEAWDELLDLAKSDPKERMVNGVHALLAVTKDERFVTARHCMQSLWKVGTSGENQRKLLVDGLTARFRECVVEKNCTLIRYDIIEKPSEVVRRCNG